MKIKLKTAMAGPEGAHHEGTVLEMEDAKAEVLIKGGFAEKHVVHSKAEKAAEKKEEPAAEEGGEKPAPEAPKKGGKK